MPKKRIRRIAGTRTGHCEACGCWHRLTIHHRIPRRYPDLNLFLVHLHGIIIPKYTCKVCRACHDYIEGTRDYACASKKLVMTRCVELREELKSVDQLARKLGLK